ncbi:MAG: type II secretion system F family protein [Acidobacteria bacterium]|nr:type II secretion system F family protein [Acidobacteriota bacterium]
MPNFEWKGKNRAGQATSGTLTAESKAAVVAVLRKEQITVTSIREKGKEVAIPRLRGVGVSHKELAIFTRQFSVMIDAGLPLVQCLEVLGSQQENRTFQRIILQVRQDVEAGATLSEAMKKHPTVFDDLYTNMVAAGEAGGILDTILQRLAQYIEKSVKLRAQVRSAMIYPIAVLVIAAVVVMIILWKVIPTFAALFSSLGAELPLPTRITIQLSNFVVRMGWLIIVFIVAIYYLIRQYHKTENGRRTIDGIILKMPVLGVLFKKIAIARFTRTLGTLITSGVPILDGLEITAKTAGNAVVEDAIMATRKSIEAGKSIADPLRGSDIFPAMVVQMISIGEQTGALDAMLNKIADFYEEEVDRAVEGLVSLLEPLMIAFLGVLIGGIVVSMYLPIFDLVNKF